MILKSRPRPVAYQGDEIEQTLTFDAAQAVAALQEMERALASYNQAIRGAADGTRQYNQVGNVLDATTGKQIRSLNELVAAGERARDASARQVSAQERQASALQRGNASLNSFQRGLFAVGNSLTRFQQTFNNTASAVQRGSRGMLLSWQSVTRVFLIQTIHASISRLTGLIREGARAAVDYEIGLAEIQTISGDTQRSFEDLSDAVRAVSDEFGIPLETVSEATYQTLSNQVTDAAGAFDFLAAASSFSIAAVTDLDSSVNLLSSTLNSYNLSASQAELVSAKLFKTIELGRIRGEEFANTFGRVTVLSSQLGVTLDEVLASIASLTVTGLRYNEAFTLITNTQLKLIRPTQALKDRFSELGVASAEAGIQAFGFQGFLEKIQENGDGSATAIGELFNRVRAVRGVLGLAGDQAERFAENLAEIQAADEIDLDRAQQFIFETNAKQVQIELTELRNFFVEDLGRAGLAAVNNLFAVFGGGIETIRAFSTSIAAGAAAFLLLRGNALTAIATVISQLATATGRAILLGNALKLALSPTAVAVGVGAAVLAINALVESATSAAERSIDTQKRVANEGLRTQQRIEQLRRRSIEETERGILASTARFLQERQQLFVEDAKEAARLDDLLFNSLGDQVADRLSAVEQFVGAIRDASQQTADEIANLQRALAGAEASVEAFDFERQINGLSEGAKASAQIARATQLLQQSNSAILQGDRERAETLRQQGEQLARQALSTADQTKNRVLVSQAEDTVRRALQQNVQLRQLDIQAQQQAASEAEKARAGEEARLNRVKQLAQRIQELELIGEGISIDPMLDPEAAREEAARLGEVLQTELADAASTALGLEGVLPGAADLGRQISERFRDGLTGQPVASLSELIRTDFNIVIEKLRQQATSLSDGEKIALSSVLDFGTADLTQGFAGLQSQLVQRQKDLQNARKATTDLEAAQTRLAQSLEAVDQRALALGQDLVDQTTRGLGAAAISGDNLDTTVNKISTTFNKFLRSFTFGEVAQELRDAQTGAVNLGVALVQLERDAAAALQANDADAAADALAGLAQAESTLRGEGFTTTADSVRGLIKELGLARDALDEIQGLQAGAEVAAPLSQAILGLEETFGRVEDASSGFGTSAQDAFNSATQESNELNQSLETQNRLLGERNRLLDATPSGGRTGAQFGKFFNFGGIAKYFQDGGFTPQGRDSIPAALSAGESVINARDTRRFFSQIQAMNGGIQPQFREQGGTVTNVGDVNITVNESTTPETTSREVAQALKREIRRGTLSFGG